MARRVRQPRRLVHDHRAARHVGGRSPRRGRCHGACCAGRSRSRGSRSWRGCRSASTVDEIEAQQFVLPSPFIPYLFDLHSLAKEAFVTRPTVQRCARALTLCDLRELLLRSRLQRCVDAARRRASMHRRGVCQDFAHLDDGCAAIRRSRGSLRQRLHRDRSAARASRSSSAATRRTRGARCTCPATGGSTPIPRTTRSRPIATSPSHGAATTATSHRSAASCSARRDAADGRRSRRFTDRLNPPAGLPGPRRSCPISARWSGRNPPDCVHDRRSGAVLPSGAAAATAASTGGS